MEIMRQNTAKIENSETSRFVEKEVIPALCINEEAIRRVAAQRLPRTNVAAIFMEQLFYESWVRLKTRMSFRSNQNAGARSAYCAMSGRDFEGINARQRWANWRSIPRNLNSRVPNRPLKVVDLCCGVGHSTEVLAAYLAPGSAILGLEYNPQFVAVARQRYYADRTGSPALVRFHAQSVLETFRDADGARIEDASIDLINSCGAVAHHFDSRATQVLVREIRRVLKPGGFALIDAGKAGTDKQVLRRISEWLGFEFLHETKSCFVDNATHMCFRKLNELSGQIKE